MPKDPLFCPSLTAKVYDYLFKGLSQPLIGTFTINLGDIFHGTDKVKKILELSACLKSTNKTPEAS